jgi:hypothetical protein
MKLDLREYTDPNDIAEHALAYFDSWRLIQYLDRTETQTIFSFNEIMNDSEFHREWLVENVPWLVPYLDKEIVNFLVGK